MNARRICFRFILTMSALLLVGCGSSGKSPDNALPVITLTGDNPQVMAVGEAYVELGATASDNRDGDLTASIVVNASAIDSAVPGTYQVSYNVSDAAGNAATTVMRTVTVELTVPEAPTVSVTGDIKTLNFSWSEPKYVDYYRLMENPDGHSGFTQVGENIPAGTLTFNRNIAVHLFDWVNAQYMVEACNVTGCNSSVIVTATDVMLNTIGYFKASNTGWRDLFGSVIALSADGRTLAVGARLEDGNATGVNGDQNNNLNEWTGAVYLFRFDGTLWSQEAYIKASRYGFRIEFGSSVALSADGNTLAVGAPKEGGVPVNDHGAVYVYRFDGAAWYPQSRILGSNTSSSDRFGGRVALSADGNTLAVGAYGEASNATGINGNQFDDTTCCAGAAYVFRFNGTGWLQQAYVKASNTEPFDGFSFLTISADGNTLAVGAGDEDSNATGINGDQNDNSASRSGAVYLYRFDGTDWSQQAYIKASNTGEFDRFGWPVALSADGNLLAVGATGEDSNADGVDGDQNDNSSFGSGAVYLFHFDGANWLQQAYIKAPKTGSNGFGGRVALSADGFTMVVGAGDSSNATGINGDQNDDSAPGSGAAYLFRFDGTNWSQQAYIKASNTDAGDGFGSVAISADGGVLAVGAPGEDSSATGIGGDQSINPIIDPCRNCAAGAVYVY